MSKHLADAKPPSDKAHATAKAIVESGAAHYRRAQILPRLLPARQPPASTDQIVLDLQNELRKARARAGHWSYDLNHHISLLQAIRAELAGAQQTKSIGS